MQQILSNVKHSSKIWFRKDYYMKRICESSKEALPLLDGTLFKHKQILLFVQPSKFNWNAYKVHILDMKTNVYSTHDIRNEEDVIVVRNKVESDAGWLWCWEP